MQVLITHGSLARTRVLQFQRWQILLGALALAVFLMLVSGIVIAGTYKPVYRPLSPDEQRDDSDGRPEATSAVRPGCSRRPQRQRQDPPSAGRPRSRLTTMPAVNAASSTMASRMNVKMIEW